jgi:RNA polymerase sigma-70 factor, ECF subfamily
MPAPSVGNEEFSRLVDPFRRELLAHCYRMLGSLHDAEDAVQEAYLRAWRSYDGFEGRSSLRQWLYRIATNASLRALEQSGRRPLPSGLGAPSDDPDRPIAPDRTDVRWLEPFPDSSPLGDPADVVGLRGSIRLAFVAALQHLPPRQRAVLILRDVLAMSAAEVAELMESSAAAVNSMLQRARAQLAEVAPAEDTIVEPTESERRALLERYMAAFENADIADLQHVLLEDAALEMPPQPTRYVGRTAVAGFFRSQVLSSPRRFRMVGTTANGQDAVAAYMLGDDGCYRAHALQVLTLDRAGVARIVVFRDESLFPLFGLPLTTERVLT